MRRCRRTFINSWPIWNSWRLALSCLLLLVALPGAPASAAPARQEDPAAQCRVGMDLAKAERSAEALPLLEAGVAGLAADPAADPGLLGDYALQLGQLLERQGDSDAALAAYERAVRASEGADNGAAAMQALERLGKHYEARGQSIEALETYRRWRDIARAQGDRLNEIVALGRMYFIFFVQQRWQEAMDLVLQMQQIGREITEQTSIATFEVGALLYTMQVLAAQHRCTEALAVGQQALDRGRDDPHLNVPGNVLFYQGECAYADQRYDEALEYYQQALEISRARGDQHTEFLVLESLVIVHQRQQQYEQALALLQQALQQARKVKDRDREASLLGSLSGVYRQQQRYAEALEAAQQVLQHAREQRNLPSEAFALMQIGDIYRDQQRYAEAVETHQQALRIARQIGSPFMEGIALDDLAEDYEARQRLEEALASGQQALEVFDRVRTMVNAEAARMGIVNDYYYAYNRPVWLAHRLGDDDLAFAISERGRARVFLDTLATGVLELSDAQANALLQEERHTFILAQQTQEALNRARAQHPPDPARLAALEVQAAEAESAHAAALNAIAQRNDQLASLVPGRVQAPLTRADVQALLPPDATLLSYWIGEARTLAFIITPTRITTVELPLGDTEVDQRVWQLRAALVSAPPRWQITRPEAAVWLYENLIAPLRPELRTRRLIIVPQAALHYLPFAALSDDQGRFLGETFALSVLPSASVLRYLQRDPPAPGAAPRALVLANADYTLPSAAAEAQAIARLFESTVLLGDQATEQALREQAAQADILHFATHGKFLPDAPLESYLVLASDPSVPTDSPPASARGDDNPGVERLKAAEVYGLDLRRTRLVVLSACEGNVNDVTGNDLIGLTRAFFFSGAPGVVASLWLAPDEATRQLMERFYTHLRAGASPDEALQRAQQEMRRIYPNPYYWAGFVLVGDGSQPLVILPWWQRVPWWAWPAAVALLGGTIASVLVTRRWDRGRDRMVR